MPRQSGEAPGSARPTQRKQITRRRTDGILCKDRPYRLLLDEPGLSLDPAWRKRLQDTLKFEAERGKTVLLTTHLVAEWNNVADRCLLCVDGIIERELDPTNLPNDFDVFEDEPANLIKIDNERHALAL